MYETLAGTKLDATITAHSTTHAAALDRDALFELLADHTDLLQGVFSMLLRSAFAKASTARQGYARALTAGRTISNTVPTPCRLRRHGAAVPLDDRLHDRQAESRSAACERD